MKYNKEHVQERADMFVRGVLKVRKGWQLDYQECCRSYHAGYKRAIKEINKKQKEQ